MDTANIILSLEKLCFSYPGRKDRVLDSLDFSLGKGEKIGLIGPNGSGKSTLLHMIMGLLKPVSGTICLFGKEMGEEDDFREARQKVGFLFQNADDQLFYPTVLEDVAFGPLNQGKTPEEARKLSQDILKRLELDGFEDRVTYKLSGGEKKLVSLATVLVMNPELLILDEPTTGLDPDTVERIIRILERLEISFLVVSHQYDFLARITRDIYRVKDGGLVYDGKASLLRQ